MTQLSNERCAMKTQKQRSPFQNDEGYAAWKKKMNAKERKDRPPIAKSYDVPDHELSYDFTEYEFWFSGIGILPRSL